MQPEVSPIIFILIGITALISISAFNNRILMGQLIHTPYDIKRNNQWYRLLTSGFLHADWQHLIFNMLTFYFFAPQVFEAYHFLFDAKGIFYFLMLYLGGIVISDLPSFVKNQKNPAYASLGASGGVSAVLFAFIFLFPDVKLQLLILPIPISGIIWGIIYLAGSFYMSQRGGGRINHSAHITGAFFGVAYTLMLKPTLLQNFIDGVKNIFPTH